MQPEKPFTILLVDDEPPIFDILSRVAKNSFPETAIINTHSPQETFDYLNNLADSTLNLILLDIELHQAQNGIDMLQQILELLNGRVPIIMLTSQIDDLNVTSAYAKGAVSYILKPDDLSKWRDFVSTLRKYWYELNQLPS